MVDKHYLKDKFTKVEAEILMQEIAALRAEAREMRKANNDLVAAIWENDPTELGLTAEMQEIRTRKREALRAKSDKEGYADKYDALIKKIQVAEINLYGVSDVGYPGLPFEL